MAAGELGFRPAAPRAECASNRSWDALTISCRPTECRTSRQRIRLGFGPRASAPWINHSRSDGECALDRYMEDQEFNTGKPLKDAHSRINLHIRPALGKGLVCELTLERIKTWRNGLVTKPKHQRTGKHSKKTMVVVDLNDKRIRDRRKD